VLADLPTACDVGVKKNSKGFKETWVGYKLHTDFACGQIPVCVLTSASVHDSQVREDARRVCEVKIAVKALNRTVERGPPICVRVA
jgi:hypothetical protein